MSIGPDIKEVIEEVGDAYTILRDSGDISGECVKLKLNAQVTKPFIREFFMEGWLSYDTQAVAGDWVRLDDGRVFIIMNRTPKMFEGSVIRYNSVLYKTNVVVTIKRQQLTTDDFEKQKTWPAVKTDVPVLLTEALYGNVLDVEEDLGQLSMAENDLYIPTSVGIEPSDRVFISDTEYYKVEAVRHRRFENVDLATVGEDTRG